MKKLTLSRIPTVQPLSLARVPTIVNKIDDISGVFPQGTKEITENGTYDVTTDKYVEVETPTMESYFETAIPQSSGTNSNQAKFWTSALVRKLPDFTIADGVTNLSQAFRDCYWATSVKIKGDASRVTNVSSMFYGAANLTSIDLTELDFGNTILNTSSYTLFRNCASLKEMTMPPVRTTVIQEWFEDCANIERIDMRNVTFTGGAGNSASAFSGCQKLTTLIVGGTAVWNTQANTFTNSGIATGICTIYVPDDLVAGYKSHSVWGTYTSQIKPISELPEDT